MILMTRNFLLGDNVPPIPEEVIRKMEEQDNFLVVEFEDSTSAKNVLTETIGVLTEHEVKYWLFYGYGTVE